MGKSDGKPSVDGLLAIDWSRERHEAVRHSRQGCRLSFRAILPL
jgi:hypothetical protein